MATALANLATVISAYRTTLDSISDALTSANDEMASLKRKIKIQSNPTEKIDSSMGITSRHIVFSVGSSTPVHPASGLSKDSKKRQPRQTKWEGAKTNDHGDRP